MHKLILIMIPRRQSLVPRITASQFVMITQNALRAIASELRTMHHVAGLALWLVIRRRILSASMR